MSNTPNLQLPFLDANQNQKHVTHNAALTILDVLVNPKVESNALASPPGSPGDGQIWIVAAGAGGAWAGKDGQLAAWQDGAWSFYPPRVGTIAFAANLGQSLQWTGSAWAVLVPAGNPAMAFIQALIFG